MGLDPHLAMWKLMGGGHGTGKTTPLASHLASPIRALITWFQIDHNMQQPPCNTCLTAYIFQGLQRS